MTSFFITCERYNESFLSVINIAFGHLHRPYIFIPEYYALCVNKFSCCCHTITIAVFPAISLFQSFSAYLTT